MLGAKTANMQIRGALLLFCPLLILLTDPPVTLMAQEAASSNSSRALSDSLRRVVFERGAFIGAHTAMPRWDNGYLISREVETVEAGVPNVRLYGPSGKLASEAAVWFPGSQRVLIYSATATADGRIIAGGKAEKTDGTFAPFIALADQAGKMTNVIQTAGFAPVNICQAPDGTVWSFGGTGYDENSEPNPGDTLRHFDFQKGEVGSYLSRSAFPKQLHPGPEVLAYIRCSEHEVVAYSTSAREYVEMKYENDSPHVCRTEAPAGLRLVGFAAIGPKQVFGHFSHGSQNGLYYLSFNEEAGTARWLPVEGTVGAHTKLGVIIGLWGTDGGKLLVSRAEDSAGTQALHWVTPVE
jgi:hypothetical protein